ncbi:mannosyltransferase [Lecanora helva]
MANDEAIFPRRANQKRSSQTALTKNKLHLTSIYQNSSVPVFCIFACVNLLAAIYAPIQDCDEVFNYWEPTHYLEHGFGLQTWEYSPEYAIRSWLYILLHALPGKLTGLFLVKRRYEFFAIRAVLALTCASAQTCLFRSIMKAYNFTVASIFMIAMITTPGMFHASVAYLPSSFAMYTSMMGLAAFLSTWSDSKTRQGITWFGIGATVGWPFSAALILPLFADELTYIWVTGRISEVADRALGGVVRTLLIMPFQIAVDVFFYHKIVFVPWRIVSYNVFSDASSGPNIFGTEPGDFYVRNLLLNFNAWFLLAMSSGPLLLLRSILGLKDATRDHFLRSLGLLTPFYLWLAIFSAQTHKEERFMYPAYPFLCFNAALALHYILFYLGQPHNIFRILPARVRLAAVVVFTISMAMSGLLRTIGTNPAYSQMQGNVCLGKEWYRFPSSYFLPKNMRAKFIKSAFDGLLPGQFSEATTGFGLFPTWLIPPGMNDKNIEDPGKYTDINHCTFLVDSYFPGHDTSVLEPSHILDTKFWEEVQCSKFLDASWTHFQGRLFPIPEWSVIPARYHRKWGRYCLLRRKRSAT